MKPHGSSENPPENWMSPGTPLTLPWAIRMCLWLAKFVFLFGSVYVPRHFGTIFLNLSTATVLQYKKMHTLTMDRRKFSKKRLRRFFENFKLLLIRKVIKGYPKNPYFFLEKIDKTSHIDRKCAIFHIKIRNFLKKPNKKRFFRDWKSKITEFAKNSPKYMKMQFFRNCDFF